ncbi:MAG: LysR family transcriptional regulator [Gammaproteobacteria bacterium]|nr:LysR family transcriptional regulator [Gammaproteobacteria bacterium]
MNLKQLRFAQSVAKTHSFSKAAEMCFATQPTLSNSIAQLEKELGGKIFIRTTRKVELTPFGEYILPFLTGVLDSKNELEKAAHSYHNPEHSLLRIGLSPLIDINLVNHVLAPFRQANPNISIFFKECLLDDLSERINNQQIDFAILPDNIDVKNSESLFFYDEPLYYIPQEVGLSSHEMRNYKISELSDIPIILTGGGCGLNGLLENLFKSDDVHLTSYPGQALSYTVIEEWASHGIGAGILPKAKISLSSKVACALFLSSDKPAKFSYKWIWHNDISSNNDLSCFVEFLQTKMPSLLKQQIRLAVA